LPNLKKEASFPSPWISKIYKNFKNPVEVGREINNIPTFGGGGWAYKKNKLI